MADASIMNLLRGLMDAARQPLEVNSSREFEVTKELAEVTIEASEASWVAILDQAESPVALDGSGANTVDFKLGAGSYRAASDGQINSVDASAEPLAVPDPATAGSLLIETDAPDVHVVDGIGEIPADGTSYCTFNLTKLDATGTRTGGSDVVYFRSSGGELKAKATARAKIARQVKLSAGRGSFVLISDTQPRVVTVTILAEGLEPQYVQVEFTPT